MFRIITKVNLSTPKCFLKVVPMNTRLVFRCDQALLRRFATDSGKKITEESLKTSEQVLKTTIQDTVPKVENIAAKTASETATNATKDAAAQATTKTKKEMSTPMKWFAAFNIGFFASGLGSMVGLGGGFIMICSSASGVRPVVGLGGAFIRIPMMTGFFGATQHMAQGTSLAAIVLTGLTSAITYYKNDSVDLPAALVLTCSAMILSRFSARFTSRFDSKKLKKIFGWFSILVSPTVPLKSYLLNKKKKEEEQAQAAAAENPAASSMALSTVKSIDNENTSLWKKMIKNSIVAEHWQTMLGTGVVSGAISGFFGVGGGSIITPALCLLTNLSQQKVVGTTLVCLFSLIQSPLGFCCHSLSHRCHHSLQTR